MKNLIRKILKEDLNEKLVDKIIKKGAPYFKTLIQYGIDDQKELIEIFEKIFEQPINRVIFPTFVTNSKDLEIYVEDDIGDWRILDYDKNGNVTFDSHSDGTWTQYEYNEHNQETFVQYWNGSWIKYRYNEKDGMLIYKERSDGSWEKWDHDDDGNLISYENDKGDEFLY